MEGEGAELKELPPKLSPVRHCCCAIAVCRVAFSYCVQDLIVIDLRSWKVDGSAKVVTQRIVDAIRCPSRFR